MTRPLYFNEVSLPASSQETATVLFVDMITGIQRLVNAKHCSREWHCTKHLYEMEFADRYSVSDFRQWCCQSVNRNRYRDIIVFLGNLISRYPVVENLSPKGLSQWKSIDVFVSQDARNSPVFAAALVEEGIVISLNTHKPWDGSALTVSVQFYDEKLEADGAAVSRVLPHLPRADHAQDLAEQFNRQQAEAEAGQWRGVRADIIGHQEFISWFEAQPMAMRKKMVRQINMVHDLRYRVSDQYVKTLDSPAISLFELRIIFSGNNNIRLMFVRDQNRRTVYLHGGVKNDENWYTSNLPIAVRRYQSYEKAGTS